MTDLSQPAQCMPMAISDDLKTRIVKWYYKDQLDMRDISITAWCSIGLVSKVLRNYCEYEKVNNPYSHCTGHPPYLAEPDLLYLNEIISANPSLFLDKIQQKLASVCGVNVSIALISRALASLDLSCKSVTKEAVEQNEELCTVWEAMMVQYLDPDLFVALDESAVDDKTGQ